MFSQTKLRMSVNLVIVSCTAGRLIIDTPNLDEVLLLYCLFSFLGSVIILLISLHISLLFYLFCSNYKDILKLRDRETKQNNKEAI